MISVAHHVQPDHLGAIILIKVAPHGITHRIAQLREIMGAASGA